MLRMIRALLTLSLVAFAGLGYMRVRQRSQTACPYCLSELPLEPTVCAECLSELGTADD